MYIRSALQLAITAKPSQAIEVVQPGGPLTKSVSLRFPQKSSRNEQRYEQRFPQKLSRNEQRLGHQRSSFLLDVPRCLCRLLLLLFTNDLAISLIFELDIWFLTLETDTSIHSVMFFFFRAVSSLVRYHLFEEVRQFFWRLCIMPVLIEDDTFVKVSSTFLPNFFLRSCGTAHLGSLMKVCCGCIELSADISYNAVHLVYCFPSQGYKLCFFRNIWACSRMRDEASIRNRWIC